VYDTMWDATARAAYKLAEEINHLSPDTLVKVYNISKEDKNEIMTDVFKSKAIAVGSHTVGRSTLSSVDGCLHLLDSLNFKYKKAAAFGTYGWSGESAKEIQDFLITAGYDTVDSIAKIKWTVKDEDLESIKTLAKDLVEACK